MSRRVKIPAITAFLLGFNLGESSILTGLPAVTKKDEI